MSYAAEMEPRFREPEYPDEPDFDGFSGTYIAEDVDIQLFGLEIRVRISVPVEGVSYSWDMSELKTGPVVTICGDYGKPLALDTTQGTAPRTDEALRKAVADWLDAEYPAIEEWATEQVRWS
jgi:hypothetical protein